MKMNLKQAAYVVALAALVVSGLISNSNTASADEFRAKPGDTVEVNDGDTVVVDVPKSKTKVKLQGQRHEDVTPAPAQMADDDFSAQATVAEPEDPTSTVELAVRGLLSPSGPQLGGSLGISYKPANRLRLYLGANIAKGWVDLNGTDNKMVVFGFTAGASKLVTRTFEIGLFGAADWAYRGLTKEVATSFIGAGPALRLNKFGFFFESGLMIGGHKKFTDEWDLGTSLSAAIGVHF